MDEQAELPWRTPADHEHALSLGERSQLLVHSLIQKTVDVGLAVDLNMGEDVIEFLVDEAWVTTRALALDPTTVDVVLDALFQALAADAGLAYYEHRKRLEERRGLEAE